MGKGIAVVFTTAVAFGAGVVAGMLMAPESGEENRKKLGAQLRTYTDSLEKQLREVERNLSKVEKQVVETSNELRTRVREAASRAKEEIVGVDDGSPTQWEMNRSDLAQDLPRMPKV
jgi:gas vesicle protein